MKFRLDIATFLQVRLLPLLMVLVAAVFASGTMGSFVIDDRTYFIDNDLLTHLRPWDLAELFAQPSNYWGEFLPLRDLLYVWQYHVFGVNPFGYHVVSLLLYLAVIVLAWKMLRSINVFSATESPSLLRLGFPVAFFALHPVHVESVVYISGQKDLLCALFSFAALSLLLHLLNTGWTKDLRVSILFLVCYYAAFLSKNLAVATALTITLLGFMYYRKRPIRWSALTVAWMAINLPILYWLHYSTQFSKSLWGRLDPETGLTVAETLVRAVRIFGEHFLLLVWPVRLNFGYPFDLEAGFDLSFWSGLSGLILLTYLFCRCNSWNIRLGVLLIVAYLLPVSQIFYQLHNAAIYDRYLFVPVLGLGILLGAGLSRLSEAVSTWRRPLATAAVVMLVLLGAKTLVYIPVYRTEVAVAHHAYTLFPAWNATSFNYAVALIEQGEIDRARVLLDSEPALSRPTWVPDYLYGWIDLEEGKATEALSKLQRSLWLSASGGYFPYAAVPLARAHWKAGNRQQSLAVLEAVLRSSIYNPLDYYRAKLIKEAIIREQQ